MDKVALFYFAFPGFLVTGGMKKKLIFLILVTVIATSGLDAWAQDKGRGGNPFYVFTEKMVKFDKKKVRYREVLTTPTDTAPPALVIYLHGGSGVGSDNEQQLRSPGIGQIYDYLTEHGIKAYFLVPQCEDESSWSGYNPPPKRMGRRGPGAPHHREVVRCPSYNPYVKALADMYVQDFGADSSRIYIFGASMGGDGVWHIVKDNPHYFAAVMAASGIYRGMGVPDLGGTPLLYTKGTREGNYSKCVQMIDDIRLLGGEVNFQPMDGCDHRSAIDDAFTRDRIAWVMSHRR